MLTLLLTSALCTMAAEPPMAVAMVLTTKGDITLEQESAKPRRLGAGEMLRPGDRLRAGSGAEAVLIFWEEARQERLKPKAQATVGAKGCTPPDSVERVKGKKLPAAQLDGLRHLAPSGRRAGSDLRRDRLPAMPQQVTPIYDAAVLTNRPTLTWQPVDKAERYRVELWSGNGQRRIWRATTTEARLEYPPKESALKPGTAYLWRVRAQKGEDEDLGQVVDSKFSTVTKPEGEELAALTPLVAGGDVADLLLAAVAYEDHGVYGEALAVYEKLVAKQPEEANYLLALANYYERGGRIKEAEAARAKAKKLGAEVPEK
jgi:hypothetical protein